MEAFLNFMREKWTSVPLHQLEEARAYVRAYGYPECLFTLREMAQEAGPGSTRLINRHAQRHMLLFSRSGN